MRPWEETWSLERGSIVRTPDSDEAAMLEVCYLRSARDAPLVAAAPEMARVLLDVEWSATDGNACPACGEWKPRADGVEDDYSRGHAKECALDAALKKAGVRA